MEYTKNFVLVWLFSYVWTFHNWILGRGQKIETFSKVRDFRKIKQKSRSLLEKGYKFES